MKGHRKAKKVVDVAVGESVRILRELQEMSQNDLARLSVDSIGPFLGGGLQHVGQRATVAPRDSYHNRLTPDPTGSRKANCPGEEAAR